MTSNYTVDGGIRYSYTLKSDNSRYVLWSSVYDFSLLTDKSYWTAYASIMFGGLVLIHSSIINKRNMNFVRFVSDLSALCSILFAVIFLISAYRPNRTKTAIAWDLFGCGLCTLGIQLCDVYMFVNRYKAIAKISNLQRWAVHTYIFLVIVLPYYSTMTFLPLFVDMNTAYLIAFIDEVFTLQIWGTIAQNIYFTFVFSYLGYNFIQKRKHSSLGSDNFKWIVIKSLIHCVTSSVANALVYTWSDFFFGPNMYNILIVFGIHFLFNYKVESSSFAMLLVRDSNKKSENCNEESRDLNRTKKVADNNVIRPLLDLKFSFGKFGNSLKSSSRGKICISAS